eukprot:1152440-Pelagomonas_calceolata.AAC.3
MSSSWARGPPGMRHIHEPAEQESGTENRRHLDRLPYPAIGRAHRTGREDQEQRRRSQAGGHSGQSEKTKGEGSQWESQWAKGPEKKSVQRQRGAGGGGSVPHTTTFKREKKPCMPLRRVRIAARFTYLEMEMLEGKGVVQTHSLDVRI